MDGGEKDALRRLVESARHEGHGLGDAEAVIQGPAEEFAIGGWH